MTEKRIGYWRRLFDALLGRSRKQAQAPLAADAGEDLASLKAKVAGIEMELRDRDHKIEEMQSEYQALATAKERAESDVGKTQLEKLFKRVAGPLSNLMALVALAEAGQDVQASDLAQLARDLEKQLTRFGLEPVGTPGDETTFDEAIHQRMSGGAVSRNTPVKVRLPGYRFGGKVLLKAMVTSKLEETEEQNG